MKRTIHIVFLLILLTSFQKQASGQQLPLACGGSSVRYAVSGLAGSIYDWQVSGGVIVRYNSTLDTVDVVWDKTTGYYSLHVTETTVMNGKPVCTSTPTVGSILISSPSVNLDQKIEICDGQSVEIDPEAKGYTQYNWNTGETTRRITLTQSGWYVLQITDSVGCTDKDSVQLVVHTSPKVNLGNDTTICKEIVLDAGSGYYYYSWSTNAISQTINVVPAEQIITVEVKDDADCSGYDTIVIHKCAQEAFEDIPNAFVPGSPDNPTWKIPGIELYPQAVVLVYDRWGRLVYQAKGNFPSDGWDGTSRGRALPMDGYTYIIDLKDNSTPRTGSVTIIR